MVRLNRLFCLFFFLANVQVVDLQFTYDIATFHYQQ